MRDKKLLLTLLSLVLLALAVWQVSSVSAIRAAMSLRRGLSGQVAGSQRAPVDSNGEVRVRAAHRGRPWMNLSDGVELRANYDGTSDVTQGVVANRARPLSLASAGVRTEPARISTASAQEASSQPIDQGYALVPGAAVAPLFEGDSALVEALAQETARTVSLSTGDFDEDGFPDLVTGHATSEGGVVTLRRGNPLWTRSGMVDAAFARASANTVQLVPFADTEHIFVVPDSPDWLAVGDFNGDGHLDLVTAATNSRALYLLAGDGRGDLAPARTILLAGKMTALVAGGMSRQNKTTSLAIGVTGAEDSQLLIYSGTPEAFFTAPRVFPLPGRTTALALGRLDGHFTDLVAAVGKELIFVHDPGGQIGSAHDPVLDSSVASIGKRSLPHAVSSLSLGDFSGKLRTEIAVQSHDGTIYLLSEGERALANGIRIGPEDWESQIFAQGVWPASSHLRSVRLPNLPGEGLVILDANSRRLQMVSANWAWHTLDIPAEPSFVLPMRLRSEAADDLVVVNRDARMTFFAAPIHSVRNPAPQVGPNAVRAGFTTNTLPANDDESTSNVPVGFTGNFFGVTFSEVFVNNNGNITIGNALSTFTPFDLTSTGQKIIAPFFADVDTENPASGLVTYGQGTADGRPAFGVNWVNVGYFFRRVDKLNSFQLVLIDRSDTGPGNFDFELNYDQIQWETGDASGGSGGLGGFSARAGYSNGTRNPGTLFELTGSAVNGAFLDTNLVTGLIRNRLNSTQFGRYRFEVRNGIVNPTISLAPASQTIPTLGATGALTITISPAQTTPTTVSLMSSAPTVVSVPPSVIVPAGSNTVDFNATAVTVGGPVTLTAALPAGLGGGTATATVTVAAPAVTLAPTALSFSDQLVGTSSGPKSVTLTNSGTALLTISGISVSGDYSQTNTCGNTLAPGASCALSVTFTPTATGTRTGTLRIEDNASGSPHTVALTGNGVAPAVFLSVTSLTFGNQLVGSSSPPQPVILTNTGTGPLTISSIVTTGDFARATTCGNTLVPGASCQIDVTFTPTTTGMRDGTLIITDNAAGSPHIVNLKGTGVAAAARITPTSLSFGNQVVGTTSLAQTINLTSIGAEPLVISSIAVSGDFTQSSTCGSTLAPNESCAINVRFVPAALGSRSGTLTITSNAPDSPLTVSLAGTGAQMNIDGINPTFGSANGGTFVRISGRGFAPDASVRFGSTLATNVQVSGDTAITCTTPPGTGTVDVTVTGSTGTAVLSAGFTYVVVPPPGTQLTWFPPESTTTAGAVSATLAPPRNLSAVRVEAGVGTAAGTAPAAAAVSGSASGPKLLSYDVFRSTDPNFNIGDPFVQRIANVPAGMTSYFDPELPQSGSSAIAVSAQSFFYRVTAVYDLGESGPTNVASTSVAITNVTQAGNILRITGVSFSTFRAQVEISVNGQALVVRRARFPKEGRIGNGTSSFIEFDLPPGAGGQCLRIVVINPGKKKDLSDAQQSLPFIFPRGCGTGVRKR